MTDPRIARFNELTGRQRELVELLAAVNDERRDILADLADDGWTGYRIAVEVDIGPARIYQLMRRTGGTVA